MSDPSFVVDALAFRDHGEDPSRATRPGEDVLTTLRRILPAEGLSTALRSFEPGQARDLPLDTVVELRDGSVGLVAGRDTRTMRLSTKDGAVELRDADLGERLSGRALVSYRTPGGSPARALSAMVRGDRGLRAAVRDALALSVMQRLLLLVLPFLSRLALGRALPDGERATLTAVVVAVALAGGLVALASRLRDRALRFVEGHLCERFAREVFRAMLDQPFTAMATRRPGAAWEDFAAADRWVRLTVPQLGAFVDGLFGVAFLAALATLAPAAALATSAVALVALAGVAGVASRQVRGQRTMAQARRGRHELLLQSIDALEVIRAEGLEPSVRRELEALLHREERAALEVGGHNAATAGITSLFERGSFVVVYALLGWQCLEGTASLADLVACVQLVAAFELGFRGVLAAPQRFVVLRTLRAQLRDTLDAMAVRSGASTSTDPVPVAAADGIAIAVDDVWFRHEGGPWILRDFRLQVRRGEQLTLRWPSGSGKTTLLRLLAGLYRPSRGSILIDQVFYVPQGAPLLGRSVLDNLGVLSGGATRERIFEAARVTGLAPIVETWPMKWGTLLASGGRTLSSGQRQLVLLTAAIASDAPVLLLDEALAHLDAETKRRFFAQQPFEGRTVVFVEHDPVAGSTDETAVSWRARQDSNLRPTA